MNKIFIIFAFLTPVANLMHHSLGSIKVRRQTLPEINVHARLFGTLGMLLTPYLSGWVRKSPTLYRRNICTVPNDVQTSQQKLCLIFSSLPLCDVSRARVFENITSVFNLVRKMTYCPHGPELLDNF